jgi:hypothetical protein
MGRIGIHRVYEPLLRGFRRRRMRAFARTFRPHGGTTILDVGGTPFNWELLGCESQLTLLNLELPPGFAALPRNYSFVVGDALHLEFEDGVFDVAFSNSVIEHLGSWERQQAFAREIRRVGRGLWVQTPARSFFAEPHLLALFVHWLPRAWQRRLIRNFTGWGLLTRPSPERVEHFLDETRLLGLAEMQTLFPDCEIRRERFLGPTKAWVAVRRPASLR